MSDIAYQNALSLFGQGRYAEGSQVLGQAARAGHVPSMSLFGGQLLTGRGVAQDAPAGIRLIMSAAERGGGFASSMVATLYAMGFAGQPDWPRALDYLQRAAELGFAPAQEQLRLLAGDVAGTDWKALRGAFDIAAWRRPPATECLSEDPQIHVARGLLSPELCDAVIARGRPRLAAGKIYNELSGGKTSSNHRRNSAAEFTIIDLDLLLGAVCDRLCTLADLPAFHAESCQVLHYNVGDYFAPHFDFWEPGYGGHAAAMAEGGQRVVTVLVYLNDELEGGETDFPRLGIRHRGAKGDALMFRNVDAEGQPDRRTLHAGLPPTKGEKWLLSLWIRDRPPTGFGNPQLAAAMRGSIAAEL